MLYEVITVQEEQLARIHDVWMTVEVFVVGQRSDVLAVRIATVEVQDHIVLLERRGEERFAGKKQRWNP